MTPFVLQNAASRSLIPVAAQSFENLLTEENIDIFTLFTKKAGTELKIQKG
jgi:hypothetical protein